MKKINLIIGSDQFLIKEKINKICKKNYLIEEENNSFQYLWKEKKEDWINLKNNLITTTFFTKKTIIIDCNEMKNKLNNQQEEMIKILQQTDNVIFLVFSKKIENQFIKKAKDWLIIHQVGKLTNIRKSKRITQELEKNFVLYQFNVLEYLENNLPNDLFIVKNEIQKIITYLKSYPQKLNISLCEKIINSYKSGSIFFFIEALLKGNQKKIILHYKNLGNNVVNPLILIATILTYLFFLKKLQILQKTKQSFDQIVILLQKNKFFVFNLMKILNETDNETINDLIEKIYKLEYHVKMLGWKEQTLLEFFLTW